MIARLPRLRALAFLAAAAALAGCPDDAAPGTTDAADVTPDAGDVTLDASDVGDAGDSGDSEADASPPTTATIGAAPFTVSVEDGTVTLAREGDALLTLPASALILGRVPAISDELNYDPWFLEPGNDNAVYEPPEGLEWVTPDAVTIAASDATSVTLALDYGGEAGQLVLTESAPGRFEARWTAPAGGAPAAFFRLAPLADAAEGFYGLGEYFDHVEHRGRTRAMHFEPAKLQSGYNEAHFPVPLLVGTRGWGLFVQSYRPGVFAVATVDDRTVQTTWGVGAAWEDGLTFHLLAAEHPLDVTKLYYDITGYPGRVATWALGPWFWRDEVDGQVAVEADLDTIRDLDLATTGYWIDRPYASGVNSFDFDPGKYADPEAMIAKAQALGMRMALWHTPYVDPDDPATSDLYDYAEAEGYFAPQMATALAKWGPPLDFTNPDAFAWWQTRVLEYTSAAAGIGGIEGFKLDYGEEVIVGALGLRLPWEFWDGSDELTMQRRYQILYHRAYAELLPEAGGFLLCRAGAWGDQVNGTIVWPGDIDASFARHGEEVTKPGGETYTSVGGVPASVVAGASLGVSGFPFFGSDTGGYRNAPPTKEVFRRWYQHTALSTVMQVGTNSNDLPWEFGDAGEFDQALVDNYRVHARLHLRLWPYVWTYVEGLAESGRAIQRPLGLAFPELGVHPDFVYMLGDALLVAAVVDAGVTELDVPLPAGAEWVDWWTGEVYEGGATATVPAPEDHIPLLLRAGLPVPLLRPTIDTMAPIGAEGEALGVESFETTPNPLHVRVAPTAGDNGGTFTMYDGTHLAIGRDGDQLFVTRNAGSVFDGAVVFEVELRGRSVAVVGITGGDALAPVADLDALTAADSGYLLDWPRAGMVAVKLPAGEDDAVITLVALAP